MPFDDLNKYYDNSLSQKVYLINYVPEYLAQMPAGFCVISVFFSLSFIWEEGVNMFLTSLIFTT